MTADGRGGAARGARLGQGRRRGAGRVPRGAATLGLAAVEAAERADHAARERNDGRFLG